MTSYMSSYPQLLIQHCSRQLAPLLDNDNRDIFPAQSHFQVLDGWLSLSEVERLEREVLTCYNFLDVGSGKTHECHSRDRSCSSVPQHVTSIRSGLEHEGATLHDR
jgi:hypothetical protein